MRSLSALLTALGRPILPSGITKVEDGTRRVDVGDLVAFAVALGVNPDRLLLPSGPDGREKVALTPEIEVTQGEAWSWADGEYMPTRLFAALKPGGLGRDYFAAQDVFARDVRPTSERGADGHPASQSARDVLGHIRSLAGWAAEYERMLAEEPDRELRPGADHLGGGMERVELAVARLQADLAELLSTARRLRGRAILPDANDDGERR